jgi:hypothetical protein
MSVNTDASRQPIVRAIDHSRVQTERRRRSHQMGQAKLSVESSNLGACCFRWTAQGRAWVDLNETEACTVGELTRYLHDVLLMCGSGVWFAQLRQFMPPRSLEESLQALLALGLIEQVEPQPALCHVAPALTRQTPAETGWRALN